MYRLNLKGGATFWQDGCSLIKTLGAMQNFNVDDHAASVDYLYPYLPHASSPKIDVVNWRLGRTQGVNLAGVHRVSFGICLEAPIDSDHQGTMYEYAIAVKANTADNSDFSIFPFFGQMHGASASPVKHIGRNSGSGNRNQSCYTVLPGEHQSDTDLHARGTVLVKGDISTVNVLSQTAGNPIVVGVTFTNTSNVSRTIYELDCHISGLKYDNPIEAFDPGL